MVETTVGPEIATRGPANPTLGGQVWMARVGRVLQGIRHAPVARLVTAAVPPDTAETGLNIAREEIATPVCVHHRDSVPETWGPAVARENKSCRDPN